MKKLISMILTAAMLVTLVPSMAFAASTSPVTPVSLQDQLNMKTIVLNNKSQFNVTVLGKALVFSNIPNHIEFDEIYVEVLSASYEAVASGTYTKGGSNAFTVSMGDVPNGTYELSVSYKKDSNIVGSVTTGIPVVVSNGVVKFSISDATQRAWYTQAIQYQIDERKDAYALDFYKVTAHYSPTNRGNYSAYAQQILSGFTGDEHAKLRAVHDFVYNKANYGDILLDCQGATNIAVGILRTMGYSAKQVTGSAGGGTPHAWVEVWVDGRWLTMETLWGDSAQWFDIPVSTFSISHNITRASWDEKGAWDGALRFISMKDNVYTLLKTVPNFQLNGKLPSTYGYNAADLYTDQYYNKKFDVANTPINTLTATIYVKPSATTTPTTPVAQKYTVTFNSYGGTAVKAITVAAGSKIVAPKAPTRTGYKFVAWYKDAKLKYKWNFATDKITKNTVIYAGWRK